MIKITNVDAEGNGGRRCLNENAKVRDSESEVRFKVSADPVLASHPRGRRKWRQRRELPKKKLYGIENRQLRWT